MLCSGMATFHVLLSVFLVHQALSQDASDICVDRLTNVKRCLDTSSHNAESKTGVVSSDILKRCEGLTSMAGCTVTMPSDCWTQDTFRPLKNMFDFASKLAKGCASPGGKQNMVDLSDCNNKIRADFEKCFNMNVIDQMFAFNTNAKGDNLDFSAACWSVSPTSTVSSSFPAMSHSHSQLMRWAICGAGNISHDFAIALHTLPEGENKILAVAGRDQAKTQGFADQFKIPKVYTRYEDVAQDPEIDVVYVGTFNITHYEVVKLMLTHKKHVLCEKPITLLKRHTEELFALARDNKRFLMEACWSRFFPAYLALREGLSHGLLGTPKLVTAQFGLNIAHVERLKTLSMGGGSLMDLGIYTIQFAMLAFGNEMPEEISTSVVKNQDGVDLTLGMILKYRDGGVAQLTSTLLARINCEAAVYGDNNGVNQIAALKLNHPFWSPTELVTPAGVEKFPLPHIGETKTTYPNGQGMCYEIAEARRCILDGKIESPHYSHQDSLTLSAIVHKILEQIDLSYEFIYDKK